MSYRNQFMEMRKKLDEAQYPIKFNSIKNYINSDHFHSLQCLKIVKMIIDKYGGMVVEDGEVVVNSCLEVEECWQSHKDRLVCIYNISPNVDKYEEISENYTDWAFSVYTTKIEAEAPEHLARVQTQIVIQSRDHIFNLPVNFLEDSLEQMLEPIFEHIHDSQCKNVEDVLKKVIPDGQFMKTYTRDLITGLARSKRNKRGGRDEKDGCNRIHSTCNTSRCDLL